LIQRTNSEWIDSLKDPIDDEALIDLRATLLRGLRASLSNRINMDLDSLTEDFAQDALLKILKSLDSFRGESKFTTWAQKIAINVAFTELRRRRWKDISLQDIVETPDGDEFTPAILTDPGKTPEMETTQNDILSIVYNLIVTELTDRQKTALLAVMQGGMPLEEVARRLDTNRNALYKLIFDARQRLQKKLVEQTGMSTQDVMSVFEKK